MCNDVNLLKKQILEALSKKHVRNAHYVKTIVNTNAGRNIKLTRVVTNLKALIEKGFVSMVGDKYILEEKGWNFIFFKNKIST